MVFARLDRRGALNNSAWAWVEDPEPPSRVKQDSSLAWSAGGPSLARPGWKVLLHPVSPLVQQEACT